jgi:hypothetical protein
MTVTELRREAARLNIRGRSRMRKAQLVRTVGDTRARVTDRHHRLLAIYLNDHLAGSTAGRSLVRRAAVSNRGGDYGPFLDELASQIAADRDALLRIMTGLGIGIDRVKVAAAWTAEKLARLKLSGRVRGYSPLSRIVELVSLALGVRVKLALWRTLETLESDLPALASAGLPDLIARAEHQLDGLEGHRLRAVSDTLR